MVAPIVVGMAVCIATRSYAALPMILAYFLLLGIGLIIYMVRAIRQYGRWLRDNYADLEHKEVWQSFVVMAFILLISSIYELGFEWPAYDYVVQLLGIVVVCYLLWRVETLSDLSTSQPQTIRNRSTVVALPAKNIESLLKQYCEEPQLYLQHDLTLAELCKAIGTNRTYLGQYFSNQGIASASENLGSLELNKETGEREIVDLGVDAQINLARGVIVTNTTAPVTPMPQYFGPASFHENDYSFFYNNLKENVAKRVAAYKTK